MGNNRKWFVYANERKRNHVKAFSEIGYVSWNPHNRNFRVGDLAYVFLSLDRSVRFKAKVTAICGNKQLLDYTKEAFIKKEELWNIGLS